MSVSYKVSYFLNFSLRYFVKTRKDILKSNIFIKDRFAFSLVIGLIFTSLRPITRGFNSTEVLSKPLSGFEPTSLPSSYSF